MSKRKQRKGYMKNWSKQSKSIMNDGTLLMFGKYRLLTIGQVRLIDPKYYDWFIKTFKVTPSS